jgi:hypothetical protein
MLQTFTYSIGLDGSAIAAHRILLFACRANSNASLDRRIAAQRGLKSGTQLRGTEAGIRPPGGRARRSDTITHREETLDNKRQARAATSRISQRMILSKNRLARSRPHLEWRDPRVPLQPRRGESLCTDSLAFDLKSNFARAFERIL